jgi:hypothetical protein
MEGDRLTIAKPQTVNLFDTIATGYEAVNRRPQVVLVPLLANLALWYSQRLPLDSLAAGTSAWLAERIAPGALREQVLLWLERLDLRLAALPLLSSVPLLAPEPRAGGGLVLPSWFNQPLVLLVGALVGNGLALLASSAYLVGLVEGIRGGQATLRDYLKQVWRTTLVIGGALLAVLGVLLVLALPFLALSISLVVSIPASLPFVIGLWYVALFWVLVYTTLVPEAAAMSSRGPLHAVYASVNLVRRNTAATLLLLGISLLVGSGLGSVFRYLAGAGAVWGPLVACVCSAYIGSGLAAARVAFYRERLARWGK